MNERIIMRASDLLSFAMEAKVPESEFLAAITYILAVKLASMPKRERERGLEDIRELVEACVEVAKEGVSQTMRMGVRRKVELSFWGRK